jgi:Tfp pilus assembly protein PilV
MNKYKKQRNKGFTIVEAMVAIFILTVSVSSMLGITASSAASARYANNEITANYLLQEAIDSIRNSRDTIAFQIKDGTGWDKFLNRYGSSNNKCFSPGGCYLSMDIFKTDDTTTNPSDVSNCGSTGCPPLMYDDTGGHLFYNYTGGDISEFKRTVKMKSITSDEVKVTATLEWTNGDTSNTRSTLRTQTLTVYLLNWQK